MEKVFDQIKNKLGEKRAWETSLRRATQRSVKFLRWLRQALRENLAEEVAVPRLDQLYATSQPSDMDAIPPRVCGWIRAFSRRLLRNLEGRFASRLDKTLAAQFHRSSRE